MKCIFRFTENKRICNFWGLLPFHPIGLSSVAVYQHTWLCMCYTQIDEPGSFETQEKGKKNNPKQYKVDEKKDNIRMKWSELQKRVNYS